MEIVRGDPFAGEKLELLRSFLAGQGLDYDEEIQTSFLLMEDGRIAATGSRHGHTLKCVAVSPECRGEGYAASVLSLLTRDGVEAGYSRLFLYTKPCSAPSFQDMGFFPVASVRGAALMENRRDGIGQFVRGVRQTDWQGDIGCVVVNCDPFTNGHLYLVEQASAACDYLYIFVLSENRGYFPPDVRMNLVREGAAHIPNAAVCSTGDYLISSATFPAYFIKDKIRTAQVGCSLDLEIFAEHFAGPLGIRRRFVGTEPYCQVTRAYNEQMKAFLPARGIGVVEIPRFAVGGEAVSASRVRALVAEGRLKEIAPLVPAGTMRYLERLVKDGYSQSGLAAILSS